MAEAVENSAAVCYFITPEYETSRNCRKELQYADTLDIPLIPCRCRADFKPSGWLGLISAGLMWYDFRDPSEPAMTTTLNKLINYIQVHILQLSDQRTRETSESDPSTDFCSRKERLTYLLPENEQMLMPLQGYEDYPLVSLDEAIKPVIPTFRNDIRQYVYIAKKNTSEKTELLTTDEAASIQLYSMQWTPMNDSFYIHLNRILRTINRTALRPWFLYLKLFLTALFKLPSVQSTVWRGVQGDLSVHYREGDHVTWWGVTSCAAALNVIENFIGHTGSRTIFSIEVENAKFIREYSYFQDEDEVILLPGTYLKVISKVQAAKDLTIIHLKEVTPPFPLLASPLTGSATSDEFVLISPFSVAEQKQWENDSTVSIQRNSSQTKSFSLKPKFLRFRKHQ